MLRRLRQKTKQMLSSAKLRAAHSVGRSPTVLGKVWIHGEGRVIIGDHAVLDGRACAIELHTLSGAEIVIGDSVHIAAGTSIEASQRVQIGNNCRVGRFCKLMDNAFHQLKGDRDKAPASSELAVGNDVELGHMVVLLPGAQIGDGLSIGPAKVISRAVGIKKNVSGG